MAIYKNTPPIVTNGLIMYFDAANTKSYTSGSTTLRNLNPGYTNITSSTLQNQNSTVTLPQYSPEGGGCFVFNGTGSAVLVSNNPQTAGFWPKPELTLEAWFKTAGTGSGQAGGSGIFGFTYGIMCTINPAGQMRTVFNSSPSGAISITTPAGANYFDNTWHQVITQTNGSTVSLYVDGILRGQSTNAASAWTGTSPWPTNQLNFGRDNNNNNIFFSGSIGPVRVYDRVLSAQEVLQNYNATKGRFNIT